ncbi:MAG: glycosyltransferase family 87 protein [Acidobacteriota bacterium]
MADTGLLRATSSGRRRRGRLTATRAVVVALAVVALLSGFYFARKSGADPNVYGNDFSVYYHAAREVIAGRDPYQHSLGDWTPYIYPPLLAELTAPFALLPLPVAAYFWFLINVGSVAAAAWMSANLASDGKKRDSAALKQSVDESFAWRAVIAASAVVIVFRFVLDSLSLGQVNPLVAALSVAHVYLYARDRKALSAVALVFAVSIKLTPAVLLVYHIAKLRLKFAAACAALLVAVTALSFLPFGAHSTDAFRVFVNRTVKNEQGYDFAYAGNQSLRGAVARLTAHANEAAQPNNEGSSRRPGDATTLLISIALLALASFAAVRARSDLAAAAPFFCCIVLLSPLSWKAHYVILILPVTLLFVRARASAKAPRCLIAAALLAAFGLFNLTSPRVIGLAAAEWADAHSLVFAGALLIFIACVASAGKQVRSQDSQDSKFGKQPRVC